VAAGVVEQPKRTSQPRDPPARRSDAAFAALSGTCPRQASYIARELYRALNTSTTLTAQTPAAPAAT
jgi:hypothetical protein